MLLLSVFWRFVEFADEAHLRYEIFKNAEVFEMQLHVVVILNWAIVIDISNYNSDLTTSKDTVS